TGRRLRDYAGADGSARARAVLEDDGRAERRTELGVDRACERVLRATGGERDHDARHRLGLRQRSDRAQNEKQKPQRRHPSLMIASKIATDCRMRSTLHDSSVWCAICGSPGPSTTVGASPYTFS